MESDIPWNVVPRKTLFHGKTPMETDITWNMMHLTWKTDLSPWKRDHGIPWCPWDFWTGGTRAGSVTVRMKDQLCYFCHGVATWKEPLHQCETKEIYLHVKECASVIKDTHLLAMLETGGDLVAQEAKYHKICLSRLYNSKRRLNCKNEEEKNIVFCEGMAFADLLTFINMKLSSSPKYVFRMAELPKQYSQRVSQLLGQPEQSADHSILLRQKILAHCPQLSAIKSGREYILIVEGANMLKSFDHEDQDEDALAFYRFIYKLRNCLLNKRNEFSGLFSPTCQEESIPGPLLACMSALCYGSSDFKACGATAPLLNICQLLMANLKKGMPQGEVVRLSKDNEPPLLLYTGLAAYGRNRDKSWIDEMHKRGLSVVHTMGAIDNVDLKSGSNTSKGEFHGTGISIFQSREAGEQGVVRVFATCYSDVAAGGERNVPELPDFYSVVPDVVLPSVKPHSPVCSEESARNMHTEGVVSNQWRLEADWLNHAHGLLSDTVDSEQNVSWAAYHASRDLRRKTPSLNAMLPLFHEKSTDPAMIKHGIDMMMAVTEHLNGDQTAVVGCDQPVYALGKAIQWNWPEKYGGKNLLMMLGPLHIEMAFLKVIGSLLEGCGWLQIVISSGIATSGSAEALLKVSHVKRSREVHQVTAAVLYSLMLEAYEEQHPDHEITIDEWCAIQSQQSPTFYFWLLVLNVLVLYLTFVRSVRESNYDLYKNSLCEMLPWFFLLDHQMYARWLSTHLADLNQLPSTSPELHRQFLLVLRPYPGKFTVNKSSNCKPFSDLGLDHAHEQNNKTVKGSGGAVGLTHDPASLRRFTVGGPGVAQLLQDFNKEDDFEVDEQHADLHVHHEQTRSYQARFADFYTSLKDSFMECQNPFTVTGPSLIVIDESRVVMDDTAVKALMKAGERGLAMYQEFVDERLVTKTKSIYDPMKKCKFSIFKGPKKCAPVSTIKQLKSEVQLFSRLFIVSTARSLNLDEFFEYENQHAFPSLSLDGSLRGGDKAKLMSILEELIPPPKKQFSNKADGVVFDGAVLVHSVKPPPTMKTFEEYSDHLNTNVSQICGRLTARRCDVVWDMYDASSIKSHTREQRGLGTRRQDLPTKGKLPSKWDDYLKHDQNKEELFSYLSTKLSQKAGDRHFVTNRGVEILSSHQGATLLSGFEGLEEADGRLLLHSMDMVSAGLKSIVIRSSDTDVVVLAVSHFPAMRDAGLRELWVLFATGKNRRYSPCNC
ncbi:Putative aryl-alcohol dehydrogenase AAD10 [Frankliniella fusca]|uniref:Aryl-alcohol dehydrogenase AAD10 n=1 Tax=Frankliniella fusca TaxID=407009 RepID=A0AAE1LEN7_9NEOP|nr:Putative aryl-alcohol dehydrogenase AAD10 [Frankliniella fusca]